MSSLQQVMSQITNILWQESDKLLDRSNFSIWASVLNIKGGQFGAIVQAYIRKGMVLADSVEYDKVKVALDSFCHTIVTGGLTISLMEKKIFNQRFDRET